LIRQPANLHVSHQSVKGRPRSATIVLDLPTGNSRCPPVAMFQPTRMRIDRDIFKSAVVRINDIAAEKTSQSHVSSERWPSKAAD